MKRPRLPGPAAGRRIGLLGGSFNPAHGGHLHVAETAMRRLRLDAVWWIVARGNPLKSEHGSFAARLASAASVASASGMQVSDIEHQLGLTYTIDTIRTLQEAEPEARFVWVMGADSAASFHLWKDWEDIAARVPIAIVSRPGTRFTRTTVSRPTVPRRARRCATNGWPRSRNWASKAARASAAAGCCRLMRTRPRNDACAGTWRD